MEQGYLVLLSILFAFFAFVAWQNQFQPIIRSPLRADPLVSDEEFTVTRQQVKELWRFWNYATLPVLATAILFWLIHAPIFGTVAFFLVCVAQSRAYLRAWEIYLSHHMNFARASY